MKRSLFLCMCRVMFGVGIVFRLAKVVSYDRLNIEDPILGCVTRLASPDE